MTRKDEIEKAASQDSGFPERVWSIDIDLNYERLVYTHYRAFIEGALWADKDPVNGETSDYYHIRKDKYDMLIKSLKDIALLDKRYGIQKTIQDTLEYVGENIDE